MPPEMSLPRVAWPGPAPVGQRPKPNAVPVTQGQQNKQLPQSKPLGGLHAGSGCQAADLLGHLASDPAKQRVSKRHMPGGVPSPHAGHETPASELGVPSSTHGEPGHPMAAGGPSGCGVSGDVAEANPGKALP